MGFVMTKLKPMPSQPSGRRSATWRNRERRKRTRKRRRKTMPKQRQRKRTRMKMTTTMRKTRRKLRKCKQVLFCNSVYSPFKCFVADSRADAFLKAPAEQISHSGALRAIVPIKPFVLQRSQEQK